jgi:alpha-L-rhamnosidase
MSIRPNTSATLYLPASTAEAVQEGREKVGEAKGITFMKHENGKAVYHLKSGSYEFTSHR